MVRKPFVVDSANVRASSLREYQPLQDTHLAMYFSSPVVRRILKEGGIVNENGEVLHRGRPHLPKVILPPLAAPPPPLHSLKPSATASARIGNIRDDSKPLPIRKSTEMRASEGSLKSQTSRSRFGIKTLKPLSHEEYVSLLQKYTADKPAMSSTLSAIPEKPAESSQQAKGAVSASVEPVKSGSPPALSEQHPKAEEAATLEASNPAV